MNTVRLARFESELANEILVDIARDAPAIPAQIAANSTHFAVSPFADRRLDPSSRSERQAAAVAALLACAACLGTVLGLFSSLS